MTYILIKIGTWTLYKHIVCLCVFISECVCYLSIPCVQCPSRSGEEQQPVGPDVVQEIQYDILVLLRADEAVPLIRLHSQHTEGLLPKEVHPLIWQDHPSFERRLLGDTHSSRSSTAQTSTGTAASEDLSHEDSAGGMDNMETEEETNENYYYLIYCGVDVKTRKEK